MLKYRSSYILRSLLDAITRSQSRTLCFFKYFFVKYFKYRLENGPSEVTVILFLSRETVTASPRAPGLPPATLMRSCRNFSREAMSMILSSTGFAQSMVKVVAPFFFAPFGPAAPALPPRLIFAFFCPSTTSGDALDALATPSSTYPREQRAAITPSTSTSSIICSSSSLPRVPDMGRGMPVIDLRGLEGERRKETLAQLKDACENWGFFQIVNHGVPSELMERMKRLAHEHHDRVLRPKFEESEVKKRLEGTEAEIRDTDWETCFFVQHLPTSGAAQVPDISQELREAINQYEHEVTNLAERMLNLLCENLGLEENYIKKAFSGASGPFMGTKFAKYPSCPKADSVKGLRTHTDAGGIILVLQDDVPGLQFLKDGEWVDVVPLTDSIFINTGDQLECITNGRIKSIPHRVVAQANGGRISIATFYNPASDAVIGPAPKLVYPQYTFEQYMKVYAGTKFAEKEPRFEAMKDQTNELNNGQLNGVVY